MQIKSIVVHFFFVVLVTFAYFFEFCGSNTHTIPCNRSFPDPTFFCAFMCVLMMMIINPFSINLSIR